MFVEKDGRKKMARNSMRFKRVVRTSEWRGGVKARRMRERNRMNFLDGRNIRRCNFIAEAGNQLSLREVMVQ